MEPRQPSPFLHLANFVNCEALYSIKKTIAKVFTFLQTGLILFPSQGTSMRLSGF
jgi:hypothetical protein